MIMYTLKKQQKHVHCLHHNEIRLGTFKELNPKWWANMMNKKAAKAQAKAKEKEKEKAKAQEIQSLVISSQKSRVLFIYVFIVTQYSNTYMTTNTNIYMCFLFC